MSKLNRGAQPPKSPTSFIVTNRRATGRTFEGAPGYARDQKSELFLLAVTNMVGEKTFYETAEDRDTRFEALVRAVAVADPAWMKGFIPWLRTEANMRTASVVAGVEAARAMLLAKIPGGRAMLVSAFGRADEPSEALAYWVNTYGRKIPKPIKRGIADAAVRFYTERNYLKWDSQRSTFRFADVIELTHPAPEGQVQESLFRFAIERRQNREQSNTTLLNMINTNMAVRDQWENLPKGYTYVPGTDKHGFVFTDQLQAAGLTWEDVLSALGSKVDKKILWEALIPTMGYMALLRNLRNFDQAQISTQMQDYIINKLSDLEEVKKSRQFPYRFLAAYRNTGSLTWGRALEQAANFSLANIPALDGRTLVLVDRSGSMFGAISEKSQLNRADSAALFGTAVALRNTGRATLVQFGTGSQEIGVRPGDSLLKIATERFSAMGGTHTASAINWHYAAHDRVIVITDEQNAGYGYAADPYSRIPVSVPVYTVNLAGYRFGSAPSGSANRYVFGALNDSSFKLIQLLEQNKNGQKWPWEA